MFLVSFPCVCIDSFWQISQIQVLLFYPLQVPVQTSRIFPVTSHRKLLLPICFESNIQSHRNSESNSIRLDTAFLQSPQTNYPVHSANICLQELGWLHFPVVCLFRCLNIPHLP